MDMTRGEFLKLASLAAFGLAVAPSCLAADVSAATPFHWGRMKFLINEEGNGWDVHPMGDSYFLNLLKKTSNINVDPSWRVVLFDDIDEMCKYPMLFMTAEGDIRFSDTYKKNIKEYLERGGFLYADDCVLRIKGRKVGSHFFKGFIRTMEEVFDTKMLLLPNNHDVYHCLHDLDNGAPFMQGDDLGGYALMLNGRLAAFATPGDVHCGWMSAFNRLSGKKPWFSLKNDEDAFKFGANLITYVMST